MMTTADRPFVLHVDDEPDDLRAWQTEVQSQSRVDLEICHPDEVTAESLRRASLVLVDFKIERWAGRDNVPSMALKPPNGIALLSVLQEAAHELDSEIPRAFALFTAVMTEVARGLVPQSHIVARAHNLEWVFDKTASDIGMRARQVAELAESVCLLPRHWPGDSQEEASEALKKWLSLPLDATWGEAAWDDVLRCHPPMHAFAEHTHGIGVLRWALHRVWPYPTFLLDDAHVAARMRLDLQSFRTQFEKDVHLRSLLTPVQYCGPLKTMVGMRWWRAGIESLIFNLAQDDPASVRALHEQLNYIAPDLRMCESGMEFPVLDENFNTKDTLGTADQVIEVVPDDWPPFADTAWALKVDRDLHADLAAIAVDLDGQEE